MEGWPMVMTVLSGAITSAYAVARISLGHQQAVVARFMTFLEGVVARQEAQSERFSDSIDRLAEGVREHTILLRQMSESRPPAEVSR
ncbi:MAG TPA: hypothetical protein PLO61_03760 [Fimbriimonadaceae bacterium]|mgnify:CR=1 FL=1|nr:hypothetical protein [Fimbriimonadaceae bacterium]HRJ32747.1 hypothetical protein [Fimbriimonadaceae bacterium]